MNPQPTDYKSVALPIELHQLCMLKHNSIIFILLSIVFLVIKILQTCKILINQISNWLPRRYCKNAATKRPKADTVISPKTIPDNKGSTILIFCLN